MMAKRRKLKLLRLTAELNQAEMAERCGVSKSTYCMIEKGSYRGSIDFWKKVQQVFDLDGEQIWQMQQE